jgi:hypothetical protein
MSNELKLDVKISPSQNPITYNRLVVFFLVKKPVAYYRSTVMMGGVS